MSENHSKNLINKNTPLLASWQQKLLPLMTGLLVSLAIFFFVASFFLVIQLKSQITHPPTIDYESVMPLLKQNSTHSNWSALFILEENVIARRYHQANLSLMSRLWTRYLGFITGMILSFVGAAFILGKMRELRSDLGAEGSFGKLTLSTHSPGLLMVSLGTILMLTTIINHPRINIEDIPVYLTLIPVTSAQKTLPTPVKPNFETEQNTTKPPPLSTVNEDEIMQELKNKLNINTKDSEDENFTSHQ